VTSSDQQFQPTYDAYVTLSESEPVGRLGMTVRQLAIHFGVSRMAIWRTLRVDDERSD
jgi:hypothetical protein